MNVSHESMRRMQSRAQQSEHQVKVLEVQVTSRRRAARTLGEQLAALREDLPGIIEDARREGREDALVTYHNLHAQIWQLQQQVEQERAERTALERHLEVQAEQLERAEGELADQHQHSWEAAARSGADLAALRQQLASSEERHRQELDEADPRNLRARLERERAERKAAEQQAASLRRQLLADSGKSRRQRAWEDSELVLVPASQVQG